MSLSKRFALPALAVTATATLALTGCTAGTPEADPSSQSSATAPSSNDCAYPLTVTDMAGNDVIVESADSVVVTDNRAFGILSSWGITPSAAPRTIMSPNNPWTANEEILDTGSHAEPNFDQVIVADPTLIINGYRYNDHADKMKQAAPEAAFIDMTNTELTPVEYATAQVELLGQLFCQEDEATALIEQFDEAVAAGRDAYDPTMTVMGLVTNANEIRYSNPNDGRGASVFFELLELTPALDTAGTTNHQGDDISIEAIAQANPDFLIVLDRDAAVSTGGESTPALELINGSTALSTVPAVENQAIYILPADFYLTEDMPSYIEVLKGLTAAFQAQK